MSFHSEFLAFDRRPAHPLLRIAVDGGKSARYFLTFNRAVRESMRREAPKAERIANAHEVLRHAPNLRIGDEELDAFKLEWLRLIADDLEDLALLDQLARAELRSAGLSIAPLNWPDIEPAGTELPHFVRREVGIMLGDDARPAVRVWTKIAQLGVQMLESPGIEAWSPTECLLICRAIIMASAAIRPSQQLSVSAQLAFLEGVGAVLWGRVARRLGEIYPSIERPIWSPLMWAQLLLHLQGLSHQPNGSQGAHTEAARHSGYAPCAAAELRTVILEAIPPARDRDDREVLKRYEDLRLPLPLAPMPERSSLQEHFDQLESEFPWALHAVDMLKDMLWPACLLGRRSLELRPVLLVGRPGAGKSRLARRVAEVLRLPYLAVSCGGAGDSKMLSGTSRGWSTGEPSPIINLLMRSRSASAFVLLDEVDKAYAARTNAPPLASTLLGLLEPETASRWRDPYLQAACDLTGVAFWATANSLQSVSRALLSRFEVIYVPEPQPKHWQSLADSITAELECDWRLPHGTLPRFAVRPTKKDSLNIRELRAVIRQQLAHYIREELQPQRLH